VTRRTGVSKDELVAEAWQLMATMIFKLGGRHMSEAVRQTGLNPGAIKALQWLDPSEPQPMRTLADAWRCDASNVTWLVDRLEERGLVERRTSPSDRRVRTVVVTEEGLRVRKEIETVWADAPEPFRQLSGSDLESLVRVLRKVVSA
jgi:DNA-binding MarR family transcriptional regulator